jgi:UDP-N-acetylglucosamine transferase subunit ALG13
VIWGISGYGKTQLALQYVTTQKARYTSVLWIECSSRAIFEQAFEQLSIQLGDGSLQEQAAVNRVLEWLEQETNRS